MVPIESAIFLAVDLETTGLSPHYDRIVEVGAVKFTTEFKELSTFQTLVNPQRPIPADASRVSGITDRTVEGAPLEEDVLPKFLEYADASSYYVAHNAPFDIAFLKAAVARHGLQWVERPIIDSKILARRAYPWRESYSLSQLCRHLGLEHGKHRALGDAKSARDLFLMSLPTVIEDARTVPEMQMRLAFSNVIPST